MSWSRRHQPLRFIRVGSGRELGCFEIVLRCGGPLSAQPICTPMGTITGTNSRWGCDHRRTNCGDEGSRAAFAPHPGHCRHGPRSCCRRNRGCARQGDDWLICHILTRVRPPAARGTTARWNNGCGRAECRRRPSDRERARKRALAQERLPVEVRQQLLHAIYSGQPFRTVVLDLGLTSNHGWGLTKTNQEWSERLDTP